MPLPLQNFHVLVDNFGHLPPDQRRSKIVVYGTELRNDYIRSMVEAVMPQVVVGRRPDWIIRFYDISSFNIPLTSDEIPATLPAPLDEVLHLDEALANPQEEIIHFYATFKPALHPVPPPQPAQPSSWQWFIENSPLVTRAPSSVAKHEASIQMTGRILNDSVAPVELVYPPFGRFVDIFNSADDDVTEIDEVALRARVEAFATAGREYYSDEFARRAAILPILNEIFDAHEDGKLWPPILVGADGLGHSGGEFGAMDVMTNWKNGITDEAEYEGVACVTQSHAKATSIYPDVYAANRMPVLLITVQGPHICFIAILILHRPRVVELTPILSLRHDGADVSALDTLCRAFRAACILRAEIRKDMAMMVHRPRPHLLHPGFPSIDKCQSYPPGNEPISFELVDHFLSLDDRLLFTAQAGSTTVLVKFTRSYSPALHTFCYDRGHAPQLLGYQALPGGWFIVVMEFLEGWMQLYSLQLSDEQRLAAYEQIRTLAEAFHEEGFVHGDLRTANVLAPPGWLDSNTPTIPKLSLIDYDWGGVCGTVRYPTPQLTSELLTRPLRTLGDLMITKEDDMQVLLRTFQIRTPDD